jgi:hypothetical protein
VVNTYKYLKFKVKWVGVWVRWCLPMRTLKHRSLLNMLLPWGRNPSVFRIIETALIRAYATTGGFGTFYDAYLDIW